MQKTTHCEPYRRVIGEMKRARLARGMTQAQAGRAVGHGRTLRDVAEALEDGECLRVQCGTLLSREALPIDGVEHPRAHLLVHAGSTILV